jgi:hypothetical protein
MPSIQKPTGDIRSIQKDGFTILPDVFAPTEALRIAHEITEALEKNSNRAESLRDREGVVFAGRNLMTVFPPTLTIWRVPPLIHVCRTVLGPQAGLVRALYFDKPPKRTWSLPWHKDMTIAVRENHRASNLFQHPTCKAGIPHVEAPPELLRNMLTVRIHLDDMTLENGPLQIIRGSHDTNQSQPSSDNELSTILLQRGDVFVMRPLLTHSSLPSRPDSQQHRRTLHLEFAGQRQLPDGYEWHTFHSILPV